jgi:hypothetical protein
MYKACRRIANFSTKKENPFNKIVQTISAGGNTHKYYGLKELNDPRLGTDYFIQISFPLVSEYSLKVLSEIVMNLKLSQLMLRISSTGKSKQKNK